MWLEKHGIAATEISVDLNSDPNDLDRQMRVDVADPDYDRAYQLFFADRGDEL